MSAAAATIGIDFGASNSAVAVDSGGVRGIELIPLEEDALSMPTALFFNAEDGSTHFGRDAIAHYLAGVEGRLMRSLKSLLGSSLVREQTEIGHRRMDFQEIIGLFLSELARRARAHAGGTIGRVVLGRPVHFVDDDPARDALAEDHLRAAARSAGLGEVEFQYEPIAAAFDYERRIAHESVVLVADIGGGTSDFTVVRLGPGRAAADRSKDVLATTGIHIGGTDFDQRLSLDKVMPGLGLGHIGPSGREVPSRVFFELSSWHGIHRLYAPKAHRAAQQLQEDYADAQLHRRLMRVLDERWGHRLASDVEQAKILGAMPGQPGMLDFSYLDDGLVFPLTHDELDQALRLQLGQIVACAGECTRRAGIDAKALGAIYLTGGSSALGAFQQALQAAFPHAQRVQGDRFGGVARGLVQAPPPR